MPGTGTIGGVAIELTGDLLAYGSFHANSDEGGGWIRVDADGDIKFLDSVATGIKANGTSSNDSDGGEIELYSGGDVIIERPLLAEGASAGSANGGSITISADGDITAQVGGRMSVTGHKAEGGVIGLTAVGNIAVSTTLTANGNGEGSGGGEISLSADGGIVIGDTLSARGGVNASGSEAYGGAVILDADCGGVQVNADIDLRSGEGAGIDGGALVITSTGDVTFAAGVQVLAEATDPGGEAGEIEIDSDGTVTLEDNVVINALGDAGDGVGGYVEIIGCKVEVKSGVVIDATGYEGGGVRLAGRAAPGTAPLPAGQTQPLIVDETADIRVSGDSPDEDGEIQLVVRALADGVCSNDASIACTLDIDCTVGCQSGECDDANSDTDGVDGQFDITVEAVGNRNLVTCLSECP